MPGPIGGPFPGHRSALLSSHKKGASFEEGAFKFFKKRIG